MSRPAKFALTAALLILTSLAAVLVAVRQAMRVEPSIALRAVRKITLERR